MLRKTRIILEMIFFSGILLLFLDFTGFFHAWLGWMAKVQLVPAVLALNFGVIAVLVILTLLFGRVYCSVICPMGVWQDIVAWLSKRPKKRRAHYSYSPAVSWLRYTVLAVMAVAMIAGLGYVAAFLDPYSAFGRIAENIFSPVYRALNNVFAYFSERAESYAFYEKAVWIKSWIVFGVAAATFVIVSVLSWKWGRTYCNTFCPVGTALGLISRFSLFRPVIDKSKCVHCNLCSKSCKSSCIDVAGGVIDYSRCVVCMDCIDKCHKGAISYRFRFSGNSQKAEQPSSEGKALGRREFLSLSALLASSAALKAQEMKVDGGLAAVEDKEAYRRSQFILPPGAWSAEHFASHCVGCQLCVASCKSNVLRPSTSLTRLMQPEMSYENGFCRPECTACSEACPAGAIKPVTKAEKSSIQIGHAVVMHRNCLAAHGTSCGNCARHCPTGAISMVQSRGKGKGKGKGASEGRLVPVVNRDLCIGCGACEYVCPVRPFSAIHVEGLDRHIVR